MWLNRCVLALSLLLAPAIASHAQENPPPSEEPANEFFSGVIVTLTDTRVTISRSVMAHAPENREFIINPETKIEGKLRTRVRVTVGFKPSADGDVAVRIIVRNQQKK